MPQVYKHLWWTSTTTHTLVLSWRWFHFSTSRAHICFCLGKGARLWLVVRPCIRSFCIAHSTFILVLCFHFDLIQPLASSFLMCECEHKLDASNMHLIHCLLGGQWIHHTWCHPRHHVCPHSKEWVTCMERMVVRPYVKSFILSQSLHDQKNQVFVANVVVIDLMWEMVALNVIS